MKLNKSLLGFKYALSSELDAGKDTKLKGDPCPLGDYHLLGDTDYTEM